MAEADLDVLIRSIARKNSKTLMDAAKKQRGRYLALAAKAKNKETRDRYRLAAKNTVIFATAAARRIQISADNAADSYSRSMKNAAEQPAPAKKVAKKAAEKAPRKAAKKQDRAAGQCCIAGPVLKSSPSNANTSLSRLPPWPASQAGIANDQRARSSAG